MRYVDGILQRLQDQGIGTINQDLFLARKIDDDTQGVADNIVVVYETGGPGQDIYLPTKQVTFQVYVRNVDYDTGRDKIEAVRTALHQVIGQTFGSTYFYNIFAQSAPGYIGRDDPDASGREEFSINFIAKYR